MSLFVGRRDGQPLLFRSDSVGSSLGFYLPAAAVSRFMGLIRGVILAWLISESQFGLFQLAVLGISVLQPLLGVGFNEALSRYVPQHEARHTLRAFLARAVPMGVVIALVLCSAAWLAAGPIGRFLFTSLPEAGVAPIDADAETLGRLAAVTTFCLILYFLLLAVLRGLRMFRAISVIETTYHFGFTVLAVVAALAGRKSAGAMVACYAMSVLAVALAFTPSLVRVLAGAGDQRLPLTENNREQGLLRQMLRFSFWAALAAVMWQTLHYYPMWYLHKLCGQEGEVTAVFGGMRLMTQAVLVLAVAVAMVVQTSVTRTWEAQGREPADRQLLLAFKATAVVLLAFSALLAVSARLLVKIYPPSYAIGAPIIAPSLLNWMICSHLMFLAIHFNLVERTRHVFMPWCLGLMCNAAFGKWLIQPGLAPEAALTAAAWAGVLGITPALVLCVFLLRIEKRSMDFGTWLLLIVTFALILPAPLMLPLVGLVLLLTAGTTLVFSHDDKRQIRDFLAAGHGRARQMLAQLVGWM